MAIFLTDPVTGKRLTDPITGQFLIVDLAGPLVDTTLTIGVPGKNYTRREYHKFLQTVQLEALLAKEAAQRAEEDKTAQAEAAALLALEARRRFLQPAKDHIRQQVKDAIAKIKRH